jgi:hypothetical protein
MDPSLVRAIDQTGTGHLSWGLYVVIAIVTMAGTFLGALAAVWGVAKRHERERREETRALIRAETPSEERVREIVRQEIPPMVVAALHNGLLDKLTLRMRELLQEHEIREDERLARAIAHVERDAEEGIASLHGDSSRIMDQLTRQAKQIEDLRRGLAVAQRDIALLMERAHLPVAPVTEPDTPVSRP